MEREGARGQYLGIVYIHATSADAPFTCDKLPTWAGGHGTPPPSPQIPNDIPPAQPNPANPSLIPPHLLLRLLKQILHGLIKIQLDRALSQHLAIDVALARRLLVLLVRDQEHLVLGLTTHATGGDDVVGARTSAGGAAVVELRVCWVGGVR